MKLNLGCGYCVDPNPDVVNVDLYPHPGVTVWDIDQHPWPWPDSSAESVLAVQVFEHVTDPIGFMADAWRVLQPGGSILLVVPHWRSENSYTDPTHLRHCTERTFDYWIKGRPLNNQFGEAYAGDAVFSAGLVERRGDDIYANLTK